MPRVLHKNVRSAANRGSAPRINHVGDERVIAPISLPRLSLLAEPPPNDDAAKAEAILRTRIIRCGRDAWEEITKAETFDAWKNIGAALAIGKAHALKVTGANAPWGAAYSKAFNRWVVEHGFDGLLNSNRSWALRLHENFGAIVAWRATLSDRERRKLRSAQANVRRWEASTGHHKRRCSDDLRVRATAHWRRFIQTMRLLPPTEAEALWKNSLWEMVV